MQDEEVWIPRIQAPGLATAILKVKQKEQMGRFVLLLQRQLEQ